MRSVAATLVLAAALLLAVVRGSPAAAAEIKVLTTGAFKPIVQGLAPQIERQTGDRLVVVHDTAGALLGRIRKGESFDVVVLTPPGLADLAKDGRINGRTVELARVGIGVAVKAGAPHPDIGSVEAFKQTLLTAPSVAYIDPAAGGSSGIYLARLFDELGVGLAVQAKAVLVPGGLVAQRVVDGQAALAIHQISEILAVKGAELVGPLPAEIQNYTVYAGAVGSKAANPTAARRLLGLLHGEEARKLLRAKGMEAPQG